MLLPEILKYMCVRENYNSSSKYIPREALPTEGMQFFDHLKVYYDQMSLPTVEKEAFLLSYYLEHPKDELFDDLVDVVLNAKLEDSSVVQRMIDKVTASDIQKLTSDIIEGVAPAQLSDIDKRIQVHVMDSVKLDRELNAASSASVLDTLLSIKRDGYKWPHRFLEKLLGPLNNEFIIFAARPDGGKTTLMLHCAWIIAKQLESGEKVLWFNNEESIKKVKLRMVQSILNWPEDKIFDNILNTMKAVDKIIDLDRKVKFIDDAYDVTSIQREITKHDPKLIVIDQLYKVGGSTRKQGGNEAERYRGLCEWARDVAKHQCPVLVSSQLDGTAQGVKYPTMETLYMSKTGAQGEADAIVMIGSVPSEPNVRYIHTPKNKLTGSSTEFESYILKDTARFRDV